MMEFKMVTDLQAALPAEIGFNFDELKAELSERLKFYNSLVITEDGTKEAKADRANLNKLRDALETKRKEVKQQCLAPYNAFEVKVKELVALVDQPIHAIDGQLKSFEEKRKDEKMQQIVAAYNGIVSANIRDIIPLERILDKRWLNATMSMSEIEAAIIQKAKRVNVDMIVLESVAPEYQAAVRAKYIETMDVEAALAHRQALWEADEAFKQAEASRDTRAPERPAEAIVEPQAEPEAPQPQQQKLYALRLEFHLTMDQANGLKQYLSENGINYTKI